MQAVFLVPAAPQEEMQWRPLVDVYMTPDGWLLKFDLAGVRMEDVTVRVQGSRVTVTGVRRDCTLEEGCRHYSMEISYNRFERTVQLPTELDGAAFSLDFRDGHLLVRIRTNGTAK